MLGQHQVFAGFSYHGRRKLLRCSHALEIFRVRHFIVGSFQSRRNVAQVVGNHFLQLVVVHRQPYLGLLQFRRLRKKLALVKCPLPRF
jgi:hypothetical protein